MPLNNKGYMYLGLERSFGLLNLVSNTSIFTIISLQMLLLPLNSSSFLLLKLRTPQFQHSVYLLPIPMLHVPTG